MTSPRRVRVLGDLYHGRIPAGAVYVGRAAPGLPASRYANPHRVGTCRRCKREHDQADAIASYAADLDRQPDLVAAARRDLADVDVACWCRENVLLCHGEVLRRVAAGATPRTALAAVLDGTPAPVPLFTRSGSCSNTTPTTTSGTRNR
ncbi:DUF4326 domain-containing protein [Micromonospora sp. RV43]|uniref:DUF4326 domain-containing protein n=1 Tax=Micromonospora sp. RV43 TaxID=1661387 RepID=UPI00069D2870|nr:DUF4326 domain-containing protein [Micromonospora sp. RV43]